MARAYKHGQETDDWIASVTGRQSPSPQGSPRSPGRDPMAYTAPKCCGGRCNCADCTLTWLSVLTLLCGGGIIAAGILARHSHHWDKVCDWCDHLSQGVIALGSLVAVLSIMGLVIALCRGCATRAVACFYSIFMILFVLCGIAALITIVLFKEGTLDGDIRSGWEDAVKSSPQDVCDLQHELECSGWDSCCAPGCYIGTPPPGCPVLCDDLKDNTYTESCKHKVHSKVDDYFGGLLGGAAVFTVLAAVSTALACRRLCNPAVSEEQGYRQLQHGA
eukprot:TRINITY_DN17726_c0_g1_i1.p1 TRINITY_DN17726_c0_g1~~TRINITY_DN17726_c0_g1_i1.p1  ORF type:complete len:305 (+),score=103.27 TRINITY_DN17726_c0_g1_i1:90-917(+)